MISGFRIPLSANSAIFAFTTGKSKILRVFAEFEAPVSTARRPLLADEPGNTDALEMLESDRD
jgi:hypothetical protein